MRARFARLIAWGRASAWASLALRSAGTIGAVVALALVVMVIVSLVWHMATARSGYYERER